MNQSSGVVYGWGSEDPYIDSIVAQFPVDTWPEPMREWWPWALHYTVGLFQPLITSFVMCCSIWSESKGNRHAKSGFITNGVPEDSVGLFQMYRYGTGAPYVPELHGGIDLRMDPAIQFNVMTPRFRDRFVTSWNLGHRERNLSIDVCGHAEGSDPDFWQTYGRSWDLLIKDLPWGMFLSEGF